MTLFSVLTRLLILGLLALWMSGCFPVGDGPADEQKDPHFLAGKSRVSSMDYDGAVTAFENALISNPKSAAAHFELGLLYEEKKTNYAAAIYHFERHLDLRPESNMAETVRQHVLACKLELAKTVAFMLVNRQVQDELRRLYATNTFLHDRVQLLTAQLAEQAAVFSNKLAMATRIPTQTQLQPSTSPEPDRRSTPAEKQVWTASAHPLPRSAAFPRTHLVKSGETLAAIAKKYNLKLSALQAANPSVEARKLKAGQMLSLPPRN